jgi:hypothetical protein
MSFKNNKIDNVKYFYLYIFFINEYYYGIPRKSVVLTI